MASIPDFTQTEMWTVQRTLEERYGSPMSPELAESELRLDPHSSELTVCPTLYWQDGKAHFVIVKVGEGRYRCQFFYSVRHHYGTGIDEYDDLAECTVTLLQVQADHEANSRAEEQSNS